MQQQLAPSHEPGVPPAAAATASTAQSHAVHVAEEQPPAPTPTAADDDAPPAAPLPLGDDEFPDQVLAIVCLALKCTAV